MEGQQGFVFHVRRYKPRFERFDPFCGKGTRHIFNGPTSSKRTSGQL